MIVYQLHQKLEVSGLEPKVIVATNINPKIKISRLLLNATPGTTSFDNECLDSQSVLAASTASKYGSVKKIERVTLAELNNYVLNSPPQTAKFLCTAEVGGIDTTNGWCYFSYSKCYQKLQRGFTSFT
ncbi:BnaA03g50830D [Brassica napus]|uniref:BnaA03g50830D protein n=1 Tax=Brassica napus TaxID=3708 RepID=A0A078IEH6_BRANA|nr:BnaA03g50830D [Brassica napus]